MSQHSDAQPSSQAGGSDNGTGKPEIKENDTKVETDNLYIELYDTKSQPYVQHKPTARSDESLPKRKGPNVRPFSIRIGGEKYVYSGKKDPYPSPYSSSQSLRSSHASSAAVTYATTGLPTKSPHSQKTQDLKFIRTISSPHGVQYLPNGRPAPDLRRLQYLNYPSKTSASYSASRSAVPVSTKDHYKLRLSDPYSMMYDSGQGQKMKTSTMARDLCQVFGVFFALLVRVVMGTFCVLMVMLVVDKRNDQRFWALTSILSLFVVEGIHTVVKRRGQERKWVSLCFVFYLLASLPSVWLLELQRLGLFKSKYSNGSTAISEINLPGGLTTTFQLSSSDDAIFIMENCLVFLLILCRWLLPRGEITRDQLSQLLFVFIGMGSDVMELFQLFEAEEVKRRRIFSYIILAVWSVSLFQFTLVLTMSANPKKARVALDTGEADSAASGSAGRGGRGAGRWADGTSSQANRRERRTFKEFLLRAEVWSLIVTIMMQDGPYLAVRLYAVVELNIIDSNIIFFVCKNTIVVLLLVYRLIVVGLLMSEDDDDDSIDGAQFLHKNHFDTPSGTRPRWAGQPVQTISGRSGVTDVTNLTPASTTTNRSRHRVATVEPSKKATNGQDSTRAPSPSHSLSGGSATDATFTL